MPIFILVGKVVLLVCIKSGLIMSFTARTINKTPHNIVQQMGNQNYEDHYLLTVEICRGF